MAPCRYARLPHYDLMRRVHHEGEARAEDDWQPQKWGGDRTERRRLRFTKRMLAKVRTLVPMFWRCARVWRQL